MDITPKVDEQELDAIIQRMNNELTENQIRAVGLVAFGMSAVKVAKIVGVDAATIRMWMRTDPAFRYALGEFQKYNDLYHVSMLNQAALLAWDRVFEYLETDYDIGDKVGRINQAGVVKFVLSELDIMENKKVEEQEIEPQLFVSESSVDLIARRVAEIQQDERKTIDQRDYQVSDDPREADNSMEAAAKVSDLNDEIRAAQDIQYPYHPNTKYGEMTYSADGRKFVCHICGSEILDMVLHLRNTHKVSPVRYREMYGISPNVKFSMNKPIDATEEEIEEYNDGLSDQQQTQSI